MLHKMIFLSSIMVISACGDLYVKPLGSRSGNVGAQNPSQLESLIIKKPTSAVAAVSSSDALAGSKYFDPQVKYFVDDIQIEQFYQVDSVNRELSLISKCRYEGDDLAYLSIAKSKFNYNLTSPEVLSIDLLSAASKEVKMNVLPNHKDKAGVCQAAFKKTALILRDEVDKFIMESASGLFMVQLWPVSQRTVLSDRIGD